MDIGHGALKVNELISAFYFPSPPTYCPVSLKDKDHPDPSVLFVCAVGDNYSTKKPAEP